MTQKPDPVAYLKQWIQWAKDGINYQKVKANFFYYQYYSKTMSNKNKEPKKPDSKTTMVIFKGETKEPKKKK